MKRPEDNQNPQPQTAAQEEKYKQFNLRDLFADRSKTTNTDLTRAESRMQAMH